MRLDYYCAILLRDAKRNEITDARTLKSFDGYIQKNKGSEFTEFMEDTLESANLIGEQIRLEFRAGDNRLFARSSFHEDAPLTDTEVEELSDYVQGQFIDGYGSSDIEIRRLFKVYWIEFNQEQITGPFKTKSKRPKKRKTTSVKTNNVMRLRDAVKAGDSDLVISLLDAGTRVDAVPTPIDQHFTEMPALSVAAESGNLKIAEILLQRGADPNCKSGIGPGLQGKTPIMRCDSLAMINLLLAAGADPQLKDEAGETLISWRRREAEMLQDILREAAQELHALADKIEKHLNT
jgi:hypothetical protein